MLLKNITCDSIDEFIRAGASALPNSETPMLDARVLMKAALRCDDAALIAHGASNISETDATAFCAMIERRRRNEPIAYIVGEQEFWGLTFKVDKNVLIPRPDSECLIEAVLKRRPKGSTYNILDLGTGSGCLLCALLSEYDNANGVGVDFSPEALAVASRNADRLGAGARATFQNASWLNSNDKLFDIVIANPPYISDNEMCALSPGVAFEPALALAGGKDGLDAYRAIMPQLPAALKTDAIAIFETGVKLIGGLREIIAKWLPSAAQEIIYDLERRPRAVLADLQNSNKKD